jgi:hypothetical protein
MKTQNVIITIALLTTALSLGQNTFTNTGTNVGIGITNPINSLQITTTPSVNNAHLFFGNSLAVAGQASAKLTFGGLGIQHTGFAWIPGTSLDNGKLNLSFGGSNDPSGNPVKFTFQSNGNLGIGTTSPTEKLEIAGNT